ncbi:MAG: hypothetical protein WBM07_14335 [Chitinivibrionales bacterium]
MKTKKHDAVVLSSDKEKEAQGALTEMLLTSPVPHDELLANLGVFLTSKTLSRVLFFYELYKKIVTMHGVIVECGVRWGQTLSLMAALRGIFEPFNRHRKIIGFDTFGGFAGMNKKDGGRCNCKDGSFSVEEGYEDLLGKILGLQEQLNPIAHLTKYELVKGDARKTIPEYLKRHPETIVSLAVFDFDIYAPTRAAIEALKPHFCKGSILVFDELCDDIFPGETVAVSEALGINNLKISRMPMTARISYAEMQ